MAQIFTNPCCTPSPAFDDFVEQMKAQPFFSHVLRARNERAESLSEEVALHNIFPDELLEIYAQGIL